MGVTKEELITTDLKERKDYVPSDELKEPPCITTLGPLAVGNKLLVLPVAGAMLLPAPTAIMEVSTDDVIIMLEFPL